MNADNRIVAERLTRVLGRRYAVKDVDIDWLPGTITAVIGPNGAGKSTILGLVAGRIASSQGTVGYGDASNNTVPRKNIGYLSHASFLYRALTCRENIQLAADLHGMNDSSRVDEVLGRVGLAEHGNRFVSELSRGMVQRLAIGRVLLSNPGILLLDEPTTGLDEAGRAWLTDTLKDLAQRGCTVVVVSHQRGFLQGLATHALVLRRGRPQFSGEVTEAGGWDGLFQEYFGS